MNAIYTFLLLAILSFSWEKEVNKEEKPTIAFSFDDGSTNNILSYKSEEWNSMIREQLKANDIKAVWFVCAKGMDNDKGKLLLEQWGREGHIIANHTYNHYNFNNPVVGYENFLNDISKCDSLINGYSNYKKIFRFPYLKSGETVAKRDSMRTALNRMGYRQGWVTIDASDWYINSRLIKQLKNNPDMDISGFREFYLEHIFERAQYYNNLSLEINKRQVKHTVLLHFNLTTALFLNDLIGKFKKEGWEIADYSEAIKDPIYQELPDAMPAEQSLIWLQAKATGEYEYKLRYPGEDSSYEEEKMDRLGL